MTHSQANSYIPVIEKIFKEYWEFEIEFTKFEPPPTGNYIFLNLSENTRNIIFEINIKIKKITKEIGNESPNGLPPKYPFDPHISIIKLESFQVYEALELLKNEFDIKNMRVKQFELTIEKRDDSGFSTFPQEIVINLNQ